MGNSENIEVSITFPDSQEVAILELRNALLAVEWKGKKLYAAYGPLMPCCSACDGIEPGYSPLGPEFLKHRHGHRTGCIVAFALRRSTTD